MHLDGARALVMQSAVAVVGFARFSAGALNFPEANHPFGFRLAGRDPIQVADRQPYKSLMSLKTKSVPHVGSIKRIDAN